MPVLRIVDAITELKARDAGCIAVSGGLDNAGLAALDFLQTHGLAACGVAHHSARIGEAHSTLANGVVSSANAAASALGVQIGWTCQHAVNFISISQESSQCTH